MLDSRSLFDSGGQFLKVIGRQIKNAQNIRTIYRGVVTQVDKIGTDFRPRYSVKAKVLGIDPFDSKTIDNDRFYPSLLPLHIVALPEVGEEILLICEEAGNLETAYWIARSDEMNVLTKTQSDVIISDPSVQSDRYGMDFSPAEEDVSPDPKKSIPIVKSKPGDVIVQGRSNTAVKNTFDSRTKTGYIELVTEELESSYQKDFQKTDGSRILLTTKSDADKVAQDRSLNFHNNYTGKNLETAYALIEAIELRLLSREGKKIQHVVLGESQEEWLKDLLVILKRIIDDIEQLRVDLNTHGHEGFGRLTASPANPAFAAPGLVPITINQFTIKDRSNVNVVQKKSDLDSLATKIPDHRSEKVAAN